MTPWLSQLLQAAAKPLVWWVVVAPWEQAVLVRMGKRARQLSPGTHFRIPFLDRVYLTCVRKRVTRETCMSVMTKDRKVLTLGISLEFAIADLQAMLNGVGQRINGFLDGINAGLEALGIERRTAAMTLQLELSVKIEELIDLARPAPGTAAAEILSDLRAEAAAVRAMTYRTALREPATPFDGSLVRLSYAELAQRIHRTAVDILGAGALAEGPWVHDYLESYSETIAGGTAEIQRNIIAERILGLPREARA